MKFVKNSKTFVFKKNTTDRYILVQFVLTNRTVQVGLYADKDENKLLNVYHQPATNFFKTIEYYEWLSYLDIFTFSNLSKKKQSKDIVNYYNDILNEAVKELYIYWGL